MVLYYVILFPFIPWAGFSSCLRNLNVNVGQNALATCTAMAVSARVMIRFCPHGSMNCCDGHAGNNGVCSNRDNFFFEQRDARSIRIYIMNVTMDQMNVTVICNATDVNLNMANPLGTTEATIFVVPLPSEHSNLTNNYLASYLYIILFRCHKYK